MIWRPCVIGLLMVATAVGAARADDDQPAQEERPQDQGAIVNARQAVGADEVDGPTILEGIPALNGIDATRDTLRDRYGFYFHGAYISDPYADLGGGMRRGATYSGRLDVDLDIDTAKTFGLNGGTFHGDAFQMHGRDLSQYYVGNFLETNDISGLPTTRLHELWYEQRFGSAISIRAGQQGIDIEFMTSSYAASFIDETFGWPGLPGQDLPDGAPADALTTPAVRVKLDPTKAVSILAAVFDGIPAGPCAGDPQSCDPYGLNFRVSDPPLAILETQLRYNQGEDAPGLPGRLKIGAFGYFGRTDDQRYGVGGLPLALGGQPIVHSPDGGVYAIVDQQVYRLPGDTARDDDGAGDDTGKGVGIFARVVGAPSDRNPVDLYIDAGFSALGLVPGRPDDLFGLAAAFAKISSAAIGADEDAIAINGPMPVRSFEAVIEATYDAEIVPGLMLQPTFQYIMHPGGNVVNLYGNGFSPIPNAEVFGVTTTVRF